MKVVSACLAGIKCRYDGQAKPQADLIELVQKGEAIALCPEELAQLGTPRPPCEKLGSQIMNKEGLDCTQAFNQGAKEALARALKAKATKAILKSHSPMCGVGKIYDGTFTGQLTEGDGVFTNLLKEAAIEVQERS